jgi:RNA ligase (TIGR02306 family)
MEEDIVRKLASIQRVLSLEPIVGADRIECALIQGWKVVVKRGDFKVGDFCVYFEVDSILPKTNWSEFLIDKNHPDKPIRLKTIKLRGCISQGLAIPISSLGDDFIHNVIGDVFSEGDDLTEKLGIKKYEPYVPVDLRGLIKGNFPSFLIKTDSLRVQSFPDVISEMQGVDCYITIKVDGTSSTFYNRYDELSYSNDFGVCSRNLDLKDSDTNVYWRMSKQYNISQILKGTNFAIQAETFGPGIQGNKLGVNSLGIAVFDVFDIRNNFYFGFDDLMGFCVKNNLPMVDVIYIGGFKFKSVDELIELSNDQVYKTNQTISEGIVIRPMIEQYSSVLNGRMAFKVVSPLFLLKYKE